MYENNECKQDEIAFYEKAYVQEIHELIHEFIAEETEDLNETDLRILLSDYQNLFMLLLK